MANSIGWGQGATNNAIGWGQGAINNLISWGKSHTVSYANETDITGGIQYISLFKARITTDSGTFEAESCLTTLLNTFKI
jgi:hypothetical protein